MPTKPSLLIIDDNAEFAASLQRALKQEFSVRVANSPEAALNELAPPPDAVLLDLRLKDDGNNRDGVLLLQSLRQLLPQLPILMATAYGDMDIAVECMKLGAADFIQKNRADIREIRTRISVALRQSRLSRRVSDLESQLHLIEPRTIIGISPQIREIKQVIDAVANDGQVTVLIEGESGTGKELVARAIHASGRRAENPFVPVVLPALPQHLVESELFGAEPGAFTDAKKQHIGYLERANGGVLFLDEIGELDGQVQIKLLRFLEERELNRLGSTKTIKLDVQVIAATNSDLKSRIAEGKFREDLYFRLNGFGMRIPPLRERSGDIPFLVEHFLALFRQQGRKVLRVSNEAMGYLLRHTWAGNIRELRNALESALFRAGYRRHEQIEAEDLPGDFTGAVVGMGGVEVEMSPAGDVDLDRALAREEMRLIEQAMQQAQGRKNQAWKLLGLNDRFALRRRVKRLLEKYPTLSRDFPLVHKAYEGEVSINE